MTTSLDDLMLVKNVNDERDAPDQILIGSQNTSYCVLMALGTWLQYFIIHGHMSNTNFSFINQMRRDMKNGGHPALRIIHDEIFNVHLDSLIVNTRNIMSSFQS